MKKEILFKDVKTGDVISHPESHTNPKCYKGMFLVSGLRVGCDLIQIHKNGIPAGFSTYYPKEMVERTAGVKVRFFGRMRKLNIPVVIEWVWIKGKK
jgi:hypothetical protein